MKKLTDKKIAELINRITGANNGYARKVTEEDIVRLRMESPRYKEVLRKRDAWIANMTEKYATK